MDPSGLLSANIIEESVAKLPMKVQYVQDNEDEPSTITVPYVTA
jgi:hypothetical protein